MTFDELDSGFDLAFKPLNDALSHLNVMLVGKCMDRCACIYLVHLEKDACSILAFSALYNRFVTIDTLVSAVIDDLSGRTYQMRCGNQTIEIKLPIFSSPKELELKLKIMGKI